MGLLDGIVNSMGGIAGIETDVVQLAGTFGNNGLQDMVAKLQASGLDTQVQSWISSGANLPVSAEQLESALGSGQIAQLASSLHIDPSQIASVLPHLVDHMTPGGEMPQGNISGLLDQLGGAGALNSLLTGLLGNKA